MLRFAIDVRGTRRCAGDRCVSSSGGGIGSAEGGGDREDEKTESRLRSSLCAFGGFFFREDLRLPLVVETTGLGVAAPPGVRAPTGMESILGDSVNLLL